MIAGNVVEFMKGRASSLRVPDAGARTNAAPAVEPDRSAATVTPPSTGEKIAALRQSAKAVKKRAATLRELIESASPTKRGAELARAFARWLAVEAPGGYTVIGLREYFLEFAESCDLLDYTGTGGEMICTLVGDVWIGASPPGWQEISRRLAKVPGVSRVVMTHVQAKELGVKRGQWTVIAPAASARKKAA